MRNLIRAALVRYTKDIFTLLAMICAVAVSIMMTVDSRVQSDSGYERWIMMPEGFFSPGIIFALIAVILSVGREFSDKTIRNKMIVGCTRTQIIGAEMIAAMLLACVFLLLYLLPPVILCRDALALLPREGLCKSFVILLAVFLFCALFAAVVTMLIYHRTYALIAVAGVMIALVVCSLKLTFRIVQGEREFDIVTDYVYSPDENGEEIMTPVDKQVPNPNYIPEKQRAVLTQINNTNPATGLINVIEFVALTMIINDAETEDVSEDYRQAVQKGVQEKSRTLNVTLPETLALTAVLFACGLLCFQRRDVK